MNVLKRSFFRVSIRPSFVYSHRIRSFGTGTIPQEKIINGRKVAQATRKRIKQQVTEFTDIADRAPGLAVILCGARPDSAAYVLSKTKMCGKAGMPSFQYNFPENVREEELWATINYLNKSESVDGILVQLPLPKHLNQDKIIGSIDPNKDVDGLSIRNVGCLTHYGDAPLKACTPAGIMTLLDSTGVDLTGKNAVILGRSDIVGKPMASLLLARNCTVTICHSRTKDIEKHTQRADILIAALGKPEYVKAHMIKPGAIVIDVGINQVEADNEKGYKLVGDVAFAECAEVAGQITPVPGGVGPMTIAMLLQNTVQSAWTRYKKSLVDTSALGPGVSIFGERKFYY